MKKRVKREQGTVRGGNHEGMIHSDSVLSSEETMRKERLQQVQKLLEQAEISISGIHDPWTKVSSMLEVQENGPARLKASGHPFEEMMTLLEGEPPKLLELDLFDKKTEIVCRLLDQHTLTEKQLVRVERLASQAGGSPMVDAKIMKQRSQNGMVVTVDQMEKILHAGGGTAEIRAHILCDLIETTYLQQQDPTSFIGRTLDELRYETDHLYLKEAFIATLCRVKQFDQIFVLIRQSTHPRRFFIPVLRKLLADKTVPAAAREQAYQILKKVNVVHPQKRADYYEARAEALEGELAVDRQAAPPGLEDEELKDLATSEDLALLYMALARIRHGYGERDATDYVVRAQEKLPAPLERPDKWLYLLETEAMLSMDPHRIVDRLIRESVAVEDAFEEINIYRQMMLTCARCLPERVLELAKHENTLLDELDAAHAVYKDNELSLLARYAASAAAAIDKERYTVTS